MATNQALLFLIFIINGIIIGLIFDFFRILRRSFKTHDIITYIEDILFWIITGFILLYSVFTFNNGEIRLYMFLAVILGSILYMLIFSSFIIKVNVKIICLFKNILKKILYIILFPFIYLFKILKKVIFKPISFIVIYIRSFKNKLNKSIKIFFQHFFQKNSKKKKDFLKKGRNI